jgi:hypothetical protein
MVRNGFARDCPRFSDWRYREADLIAAREGAKVALEYKPLPYCLSR